MLLLFFVVVGLVACYFILVVIEIKSEWSLKYYVMAVVVVVVAYIIAVVVLVVMYTIA